MPNYLTPEWQRADQRVPVLSRKVPHIGTCSERCAVLAREDDDDAPLQFSFASYTAGQEWYGDLGPDMDVVYWFELPPLPSQP